MSSSVVCNLVFSLGQKNNLVFKAMVLKTLGRVAIIMTPMKKTVFSFKKSLGSAGSVL